MTRKKLETRIVYGQKLLHLHIRQMGIFVRTKHSCNLNSSRRCKNLVSLLDDHRLLQWNNSLPLCKLLISSLSRDLISAWSLFYAKIPNIFCSLAPFFEWFLLSNARQGANLPHSTAPGALQPHSPPAAQHPAAPSPNHGPATQARPIGLDLRHLGKWGC